MGFRKATASSLERRLFSNVVRFGEMSWLVASHTPSLCRRDSILVNCLLLRRLLASMRSGAVETSVRQSSEVNVSGFSKSHDEFPLLDFVARFAAKTDTSISFQLGRWGDAVDFPGAPPKKLGSRSVCTVFGWADVHHPCHGHIKARVRALLSEDLMQFESQRDIVHGLFDALSIPRDETFEADFFSSDNQQAIHQDVDRDGMSDRI